jgi:tetratricopeptide (TPR) repeat protein
VIGATFLILVVGLAWRGYARNKRLDQNAAAVFKKGVAAYDKDDYAQAATVFADVVDRFGGTEEATKSAILKPIAESRLAVEQSEWDRASDLERQADKAVRDLQRANKSPRIVKWTRRITEEIEDIRDYRLGIRQFEEALIRATEAMTDEHYDDALFVLKNDVPEIGFAPKRAERLANLRDDILRRRFEAEYASLVDRAERMLEHDAESDALAMYQAMDTMLRSQDARVISPERRQELRDALKTRRQGLLTLRERRDLEDKVRVAREAGDKLAERVALAALQERWPSEGTAERIKKLTADIMFEEAEAFRKEGRLGRAVENYQKILTLMPDYEDARERLNELKEETQRELIRSQADTAYAKGNWDEALSLYLKLEDGQDSAVTNRIRTCRFKRKLAEVDEARDRALAADDAESLRGMLSDYAAVGEIDPSRMAAEITPRIQEIERVLRRWELIAEGKDHADKKKWTQAIRALKQAKDTSNSDEEVAEVTKLITQIEYDKYMALGREALDRRDLVAARAYFLRARGRKVTDEVEKLLAHVQRMINEDQD